MRGDSASLSALADAAQCQFSGARLLALDEALDALSSFDVQQCRVVELRFFAGLNIPRRRTRSMLGLAS